jgi:hypothetical protein
MAKAPNGVKHIQIRIYYTPVVQGGPPVEYVCVTDDQGNFLQPTPVGQERKPSSPMSQASWYSHNPTCVYIGGREY